MDIAMRELLAIRVGIRESIKLNGVIKSLFYSAQTYLDLFSNSFKLLLLPSYITS